MKITVFLILSLITFLFSFHDLNASDIPDDALIFNKYSSEDGLVQNSTFSIIKDSRGFMWFGTENGLSRFDGNEFINYKHSVDNRSISNNIITDIVEDVNNQAIWLATKKKLNRYDIKKEEFTNYDFSELISNNEENKNQKKILINSIQSLLLDSNKKILWIGTKEGLISIAYNSPESEPNHIIEDHIINSIITTTNNLIWAGTNKGILTINKRLFKTEELPELQPLKKYKIIRLAFHAGHIWIASNNNVFKYNIETKNIEPLIFVNTKSNEKINDLIIHNDQLWIASDNGLIKYDINNHNSTRINADKNDVYGLNNNNIERLAITNDNQLWISTYGKGVNHLDLDDHIGLFRKKSSKNSFMDNFILSITEDSRENIWFSTDNAVTVRLNSQEYYTYQLPGYNRHLFYDKDYGIWVANENGLYLIRNPSNDFSTVEAELQGNKFTGIRYIAQHENDHLIVAERNRISIWNKNTHQTNLVNTISPDKSIRCIYNYKNMILVGMSNGLYILDMKTYSLKPYMINDKAIFTNNLIIMVSIDENNNLLVGTGGGLYYVDDRSNSFIKLTQTDGLPDNGIRSVIPIGRKVWVSTDNGLATILDITSPNRKIVKLNHDFLMSEFTGRVAYRTMSGNLLFGGSRGVVILSNNKKIDDNNSLDISISQIKRLENTQNGRDGNIPSHITYAKNQLITLQHNEGIQFKYSSLSTIKAKYSKQISYYYQLINSSNINDSTQDKWSKMGSNARQISYPKLDHGHYEYQVKATSKSGQQSDVLSIPFQILAPWWLNIWMKTVYVIMTGLLVWGVIRYKTLTAIRKAKQLEYEVQLRTRELKLRHEEITRQSKKISLQAKELKSGNEKLQSRNNEINKQKIIIEELLDKKNSTFAYISHELRTPIAVILGRAKQLIYKANIDISLEYLNIIVKNTERLTLLVEQLLELSRITELKQINKCNYNLSKIAKSIAAFFQPMSIEKHILFTSNIEPDIWISSIPQMLETVLINILSNAVKYTNSGGEISLSIRSDKNNIAIIKVKDSGIGIDKEKHNIIFNRFIRLNEAKRKQFGAGLGLSIVKELVDFHNGSIQVFSKKGLGSEFVLKLPKTKLHDNENLDDSLVETTQQHLELLSNEIQRKETNVNDIILNSNVKETKTLKKLLIIDDTPDMCLYLKDLLSGFYHCKIAIDGEQGIDMAIEYTPDIILCDVMMPKKDGFEVVQTLREHDVTFHIPILMLTAKGDRESNLVAIKKLVDDYIVKPFDDIKLIHRLEAVLSICELRQKKVIELMQTPKESKKTLVELGISDKHQKIITLWKKVVEENYTNCELKIEDLYNLMPYSEKTVQTKVKYILGIEPVNFLRQFRLKKAVELMRVKKLAIRELAEQNGFSDQGYFSKCFKANYGKSPKDYQNDLIKNNKVNEKFD